MDIIAAHRQGLLEKLDQECLDLVGRPQDFGQRAVVLHHLYDHGVGAHIWALIEARRQLDLDRALRQLSIRRAPLWRSANARAQASERLATLTEAMGQEGQRRALVAYRLYRIAGAPALKTMLIDETTADCAHWLEQLHARRRVGLFFSTEERATIAAAVEAAIGHDPTGAVERAWGALRTTYLDRAASKGLASVPLGQAVAEGERKSWDKVEQQFRDTPALPHSFCINPAQHFYTLLHDLADRRQKDWVRAESAVTAEAA